MKLLVTGGAGFIGSNFIYHMQNNHPEYRIVCLDKLTHSGNMDNLTAALKHPNFKFVKGDICDRQTVLSLFEAEGFDVIVNFAAENHVDRSISDPEVFLRTNVMGTGVLLDAVNTFGVSRFHQISTDEVYGDLPLERPDLLFSEESPLLPSSPYSASKAAADMLCLAYHRTYGTPVTISRSTNNYGERQFPEALIPLMITKLLRGEPLPIYGKGENVRDWIYVGDHCRAVDLIIHRGKIGEVYNVGARSECDNLTLVKKIAELSGMPDAEIVFVADRAGHDLRYAIDNEKIVRELGFAPETEFDEGMARTAKWYLGNREWLMRILSGEYKENSYEK